MAWEDENDEVRDINDGWVMSMPCIRDLHGLCGVVWCSCICHEEEEPDIVGADSPLRKDPGFGLWCNDDCPHTEHGHTRDMTRRDGRDAADLTKRGQNG